MNKKSYSTFNLFIRSLIYLIYSCVVIFLYSFVCILSLLLPLRYRHLIIRSYLRLSIWVLKVVCLINYEVEGLENIPKNRGAIVMSKHQSTWETFFLPLIFLDPAIIVKRELLWIPFFGWGLATTDPIVINRNNKATAMQQLMKKGKKCLDSGRFVLLFPEGTRIQVGEIGHYRLGGARLAAETGYPIIPVAHNAGHFWPKRTFIKYPGTVRMVIGSPIESKGRKPDELLALTKDWIESTVLKMDRLTN